MNIVENTFYSAIACIVYMQTIVKSFLTDGFNRLKSTFVGGVIVFLFALIKPGGPILSCLGVITTIYICNILKINKSIMLLKTEIEKVIHGDVVSLKPEITKLEALYKEFLDELKYKNEIHVIDDVKK